MIRTQTGGKSVMRDGRRDDDGPLGKTAKLVRLMTLFAAVAIAFVPRLARAKTKKLDLPYVTIDHPQFILAPQATFLSPHDMLIGVTDGKTAKAYPAAILAQHGVVQDQMADGPIAVTW
jgi:hypothetical protein